MFPNLARKPETDDRSEKENGRRSFLPCLSRPIRRVRYRTATQTGGSTQARHNRAAQLVSLDIMHNTYESYPISNITVGCDDLGAPYLSDLYTLNYYRRVGCPHPAVCQPSAHCITVVGGQWPPTDREMLRCVGGHWPPLRDRLCRPDNSGAPRSALPTVEFIAK